MVTKPCERQPGLTSTSLPRMLDAMPGPISAIRKAAAAMTRIGRRQIETAQAVNRAFAADLADPVAEPPPSLARQQARRIVDTHLYDSAAAVVRTSDEMAESALDIAG